MGELVGGGQREERLDVINKKIDEFGLDRGHYDWYADLRRCVCECAGFFPLSLLTITEVN